MNNAVRKKELLVFKRRLKSLFDHYKLFLTIALLGIGYFICKFTPIYKANMGLLKIYSNHILALIIFGAFSTELVDKQIFLKCHHADIYYLNPQHFKEQVVYLFLKRRLLNLLLSILLNFLLFYRNISILNVILVWSSLNLSNYSNFLKYNKFYKYLFFIMVSNVLVILLYFNVRKLQLLLVLCLLVIDIAIMKVCINIKLPKEKYFRDMRIYDGIQNAARQNNLIEMQKINIEYSALRARGITYFRKINYDNALFDTILFSIRRTDLKLILATLLIYSLVIFLVNEFTPDSYIKGILFVLCLANVHQFVSKHINNIDFKHKKGIYLNYLELKKLREYFKIYIIFDGLVYFIVYLICQVNLAMAIILMILFCFVDIILRRFQTSEKLRRTVVNFLALVSAYILFR